MKLTILIMTIFLLQVSALTKAQININAKQESIRKVLKSISKQSGYDLVYTDQDLDKANPVNLKLNNVSVERALQACFEGQPLVYEVADKTVMIKRKEEKSVIDRVKDYLTAVDIRGKVTDEKGAPLQGASVKIKNTNRVTVTDLNGSFSFKGISDDAILVISFIGYKTDEVEAQLFVVHPGAALPLVLSHSDLDEVQIMAYGATVRRLSTSNIASVKAEDIAKQPVDNPLLALQGRVPGLIVTPVSGVSGAAVKVQVRGQNSLFRASGADITPTEPLYVIDGIPYANNIPGIGGANNSPIGISAFSFINPNDIESISVLKDADATAIYGSRGASGVILITTKKGKIGNTMVNASVSSGYGEVTRKIKLLNTQQYLEMRKEAYKNDGINFTSTPYNSPSLRNSMAPDLFVWDQNRYTDWQDELLGGTAKYTTAQASMTGGSATVRYLISGMYSKQGYVFPGKANNENAGGHFSLTGNSANQKLRAILTAGYAVKNDLSAVDFTGLAMMLPPNTPSIYNANGELNWEPNPASVSGIGTWRNPLSTLLRTTTSKSKSLNSNVELSYKLLSFLTLKTTAGFSEVKINGYTPTPITSFDPATWITAVRRSVLTNSSSRSLSIEPHILYAKAIGRGNLDVLLGSSFQSQNIESGSQTAQGFNSDALLQNLASATSIRGTSRSAEYKYTSIFGRLTYNWADRYIVNFNARRDGSSRFGPNRKFGNFGSVGTAWIFTEEPAIKNNLSFLSFGKARFSYGKSGNDAIDNYRYLELYSSDVFFNGTYQGIVPITSAGVANPYYSWEDVRKMEFGLDLGFLKDRILLTAAYYQNRSSNQIGSFTLPATAGNSDKFIANQPAKIQNSGIEFTLATVNFKTENFSWSSSGNLSIQKNKLLAVPITGGYGSNVDSSHVGQPFAGVAYGLRFMGVDPVTGAYQFADRDGNPTSDFYVDLYSDYKVVTAPKFFGGLSNTFSYKGFSLDVFLQFCKQKATNYIYDPVFFNNPGYAFSSNASTSGNRPIEVLNRWRNPGDQATHQRFSATNTDLDYSYSTNARGSDAGYIDASFIRIKNISLSYNIPQSWQQKMRVQNVRLYVQGQNLWTFTNYKGLDPETQSLSALPQLRVITAGLQVGL